MLGGVQRHVHPGEAAERARPLACAIDDGFAADRAFVAVTLPANAAHAAVRLLDRRHRNALEHPGAAHSRTLGERLREVGGIRLAVAGNPYCAGEVIRAQDRRDAAGFRRRYEFALDAEASRPRHLPFHQREPLGRLRDVQGPARLPPCRKSGLRLERRVELDPVAAHPRCIAGRTSLADQSRGVPRRSAGQASLFEQDRVRDAQLREVVERRRTGDAATDNDDACVRG